MYRVEKHKTNAKKYYYSTYLRSVSVSFAVQEQERRLARGFAFCIQTMLADCRLSHSLFISIGL